MPLERVAAQLTPARATIGPSRHVITYMDAQGTIRELKTSGSVLVFDPSLATQAEAAGLEYVFLSPQQFLWCSVEARPEEAAAPPVTAPLELLTSQLNGRAAEEGGD